MDKQIIRKTDLLSNWSIFDAYCGDYACTRFQIHFLMYRGKEGSSKLVRFRTIPNTLNSKILPRMRSKYPATRRVDDYIIKSHAINLWLSTK